MKKRLLSTLLTLTILVGLSSTAVLAAEPAKDTKITITAVGDCTLGSDGSYGYYFVNMYNKKKNPKYFLKNVRSIFENDDLTIANMEGALTTATSHKGNEFIFKGKASYAKILSSSNSTNNFQPTPAKGKKYTRILNKISKLSKPFHTKFSKNGKIK